MSYQLDDPGIYGGPFWIRTRELKWDQIYSLAVLANSPKDPFTKRLSQVMTTIEMLQATPRVLYTLMVYGIINLHTTHTEVVSTLVGRVGIEPTHHFWYRILSPVRLPVPPSAHLRSRVFLLPRDSLCNGHSRNYLYSMREEFNGAQRRSWTFKH